MGLRERAPRAAASLLLIALAIGAAGTTGVSAVLAIDPPATVSLAGSLHDAHGTPLSGVRLVISEEVPPDGGLTGSEVVTAADGSFAASISSWEAIDAPEVLTIRTVPGTQVVVIGAACSRTLGVSVAHSRSLTPAGTTALPAIDLVAATTVLGEVCGTTATPHPEAGTHAAAHVTPPPTDTNPPAHGGPSERLATALLVGFVVGLVAAFLLLVPRPGARRD